MTEEQLEEAQDVVDYLNGQEGRLLDLHLDTTLEAMEKVRNIDQHGICIVKFIRRDTNRIFPVADGGDAYLIEQDFDGGGGVQIYLDNVYTGQLNQLLTETTPFSVRM